MKVRLVGSSIGATEVRQHLTTFLINDCLAIDAGSVGLMELASQRAIRHLFLSHAHIDHLATLPIFLDNVFQPGRTAPQVYASREVWSTLTSDLFNERLWADLTRVATEESAFYNAVPIASEVPLEIEGLRITPVAVDHGVPTLGFLIEEQTTAILIVSDTGPTSRIWELANAPTFRSKLRAVYLECSFPNSLEWLAKKTNHLCPRLFEAELAKLHPTPAAQTVAVHLKAAMHDLLVKELRELSLPNFCFGVETSQWEFR